MLKNYGRYSLREVFLIALGLLIAVQVYNGDENNKERKASYEFLANLNEELVMYTTLISKKITELKNINDGVMKRVTI